MPGSSGAGPQSCGISGGRIKSAHEAIPDPFRRPPRRARDSPHPRPGAGGRAKMTVYKSPTCGCCAKWVEHMRTAGLRPHRQRRAERRRDQGPAPRAGRRPVVPHGPGRRLRRRGPRARRRGQAAAEGKAGGRRASRWPGMPMGSPGMEERRRRASRPTTSSRSTRPARRRCTPSADGHVHPGSGGAARRRHGCRLRSACHAAIVLTIWNRNASDAFC